MPLFRKKPVEAVQWRAGPRGPDGRRSGGNELEVNDFVTGGELCFSSDGHPCVGTPRGLTRMEPGDWVVRLPTGVFNLWKDHAFRAAFDPVAPPKPAGVPAG